MHNNFITAVLS